MIIDMARGLNVVILVLAISTLAVHVQAAGAALAGKDGVMAYWRERVPGVSMPTILQAMVTPLSAPQAQALRTNILQRSDFLPAHAPAFCHAARLLCARLISYSPSVLYAGYFYKRASASSASTSISLIPAKRPLAHSGFFREHLALVAGAQINMQGINILDTMDTHDLHERAFLPRELAEVFPIDMGKNAIPRIARMLGIPKSATANMEDAVSLCDNSMALPGEVRACVSSIEALVDFASSIMGSSQPIKVRDPISRLIPQDNAQWADADHIVLAVKTIKQDRNSKYVACHDVRFPFRLFYCHYVGQTRLFLATLQAPDGSQYDRVASCHYDTIAWDPNYVAFSDTHTKPGESELCHWMREGGIVFLHN